MVQHLLMNAKIIEQYDFTSNPDRFSITIIEFSPESDDEKEELTYMKNDKILRIAGASKRNSCVIQRPRSFYKGIHRATHARHGENHVERENAYYARVQTYLGLIEKTS